MNQNSTNNNSDNTHSEFLNRYSILIDDIKYLKSRQWTITYYLLVLYAAIIAFYKLMNFDKGNDICLEKTLLTILILLIAVLGTIHQCSFQSRITRYRNLIEDILPHFSEPFRDFEINALKERFINEKRYSSWWNGFWLFTFPFITIFWVTSVLIIWYFFH
jgi:hypothetical protein